MPFTFVFDQQAGVGEIEFLPGLGDPFELAEHGNRVLRDNFDRKILPRERLRAGPFFEIAILRLLKGLESL